ncbi:NAD(P)-binding domain-containing protein [Vibrio sp. AK197]
MEHTRLAFIGLGAMGYAVAGQLQNAGFHTSVYDADFQVAKKWGSEFPGQVFETPEEAAQECDVVFMWTASDAEIQQVIYGEDGVLGGLKTDAILVDHSATSKPVVAELTQACLTTGHPFIEALHRREQDGELTTIDCQGQLEAFERVQPIMRHYAQKVVLVNR